MANSQSTLTFVERFWSHIEQRDDDGCWLWTLSTTPNGYGKVGLPFSRKIGTTSRVAWALTYGPIPDGLCVLHRCDNRRCCRPDHLFLGTAKDNYDDMVAKGRADLFSSRRFTVEQVHAIRAWHASGTAGCRTIAKHHGVDRNTIRAMIRRLTYSDVA
jgi:hypothetical protein